MLIHCLYTFCFVAKVVKYLNLAVIELIEGWTKSSNYISILDTDPIWRKTSAKYKEGSFRLIQEPVFSKTRNEKERSVQTKFQEKPDEHEIAT